MIKKPHIHLLQTCAKFASFLVFTSPLLTCFPTTSFGQQQPPSNTASESSSSIASQDSLTAPADSQCPLKQSIGGLPNSIWVTPSIISGGQPHGKEAFENLRAIGVRTIISVDGIKPDLQRATEYGMRYVHLPHGYDGIAPDRLLEIAKALRTLPGPIYIHCHHGMHRSPTAAAAGAVTAGLVESSRARKVLEIAGTTPSFRGLFTVVDRAKPLAPDVLDQLQVEFREISPVPQIAESMVAIDEVFDELKLAQKNHFAKITKERGVELALMLKEHYTELLRTEAAQQKGKDFAALITSAIEDSEKLETLMKSLESDSESANASVEMAFETLKRGCVQCHQQYRDKQR